MTAKFEYTDSDGRVKEAEAFILQDYTSENSPNRPIMTREDGTIDPRLIPLGAGDKPVVMASEFHQITQQQLINKKILLERIPVFNSIRFIPSGGLPQINTVDFIYDAHDNSITWENLGLDGFLEENELVEISYQLT